LFFQADYDEIELQKISYGVILVTSLSHFITEKRHQNNVTKIFHFGPLHLNQNFWLRQCGWLWDLPVFSNSIFEN